MTIRIGRFLGEMVLLCLCLAFNSGAYAAERGAVTAIAALNAQAAAFIGFSSGDVLYCTRLSGCTTLIGTPKSAVTAIDAPLDGNSIRVWVGYDDGTVYFCTLTGGCLLQEQKVSGPAASERGFPTTRLKRQATEN